jgi:hypothetical protein
MRITLPLLIVLIFASACESRKDQAPTVSSPQVTAIQAPVHKDGDILEARLGPWSKGMDSAVIARTRNDLNEFYVIESKMQGSLIGNLLRDKKIAEIPIGSPVKIIEQYPDGISKIMLLDETDRIGFVLSNSLKIKQYGW